MFTFTLRYEDGLVADPPTLETSEPGWKPGHEIPLGPPNRRLRVVAVLPSDDPGSRGVLIVENA